MGNAHRHSLATSYTPVHPAERQHPGNHPGTVSPPHVIVLGPNALQNQLLSTFIYQHTGYQSEPRAMSTWHEIKDNRPEAPRLYLIDALAAPDTIPIEASSPMLRSLWTMGALFNITSGAALEEEAFDLGLRGVFYASDDVDILLKGIQAILAGELWFSRRVTSRLLGRSRRPYSPNRAPKEALTKRECEILHELALGGNNQQIADNLYISLHTVKTHLYNIYRKIGVDNRLQASLWAADHQHCLPLPVPTILS